MNTEPIKALLTAIQAQQAGDEDTALKNLATAVGITKPTEFMRKQLPNLLTDPHDAILTLVIHETEKEE